ncbi:hypothetical protein N9N67_08630 [Bacteriovoracaceae bacterium]|nr:hypothetical protein [Bacteriovoracaceae bacterium]
MIKSISTLFLTFIFTFTHAMAFAPNQDQIRLAEKLDSLEAKEFVIHKDMTKSEFKKAQNKIIKGFNKELKRVRKKSNKNQTKYALKKLTSRFKRFRKITKLSLKNKKKIKLLAQKNGKTIQEVKEQYNSSFSSQKEKEVKDELLEKIDNHGSYAKVLIASIEEVQNLSYDSIANFKTSNEKVVRKPAQADGLFAFLLVFFLIIPVALVAILVLFFAFGGIIGGVIFSAAFVGYIIWLTTL